MSVYDIMSKAKQSNTRINQLNSIQSMTRFTTFLDKNAPKTPWKKLVLLTRYNDEPMQENEKTKNNEPGYYRNGLTITKMGTKYKLVSRTVEGSYEKVNSEAIYDNNGKFIGGAVNVFAQFMADDGSYHDQLLKERLASKKPITWDAIDGV